MSEISGAGQSALRAVRPDAFEPMPPALYVYRQSTPHGRAHRHRLRRHARGVPRRPGARSRVGAARRGSTGWRATSRRMPQRVELVSTLHRPGPLVRATLALAPELPPDRDLVGPDGTRHTVWRIPPGPQTDRPVPRAGRRHALHRRRAPPGGRQPRGVGPLRSGLAPWRAVRGLPARRAAAGLHRPAGGGPGRRRAGARACSRRASTSARSPMRRRRWRRASRSTSTAAGTSRRYSGERPPGSPGMDVSLLHDHVLDQLPPGTVVEQTRDSIEDPRSRRATRTAACCSRCPHRSSTTLTAIADAREVVPAKSTYFSPKPGSGIFLRDPAGGRRGRGRTATLPLPS